MTDRIIRTKRKKQWAIIDKKIIDDKNLSWRALGMLTFILSLPDDWILNLAHLQNCGERRSGMKRDATRSIMRELIASGYIIRVRSRNEYGQFIGRYYFVFEEPIRDPVELERVEEKLSAEMKSSPWPENPSTGFPAAAEPASGAPEPADPTLHNTNTAHNTNTKEIGSPNFWDAETPCSSVTEIIFPQLPPKEMQTAKNMITGLDLAQDIVDEWAGIIATGKIRINRLGCLRGIITKAQENKFRLELGIQIQAKRIQAKEHEMRAIYSEELQPNLPPADPNNSFVRRLKSIQDRSN